MAIPSIRWLRRRAIGIVIVTALALPWVLVWPWLRSLLARQWPTWIVIAVAIDAALLLVAAIWWLWWRLPGRQVAGLSLKIRDPKARADVEDNFRKTVGQALGGAAVLIGAGAAYLQFTQQQQAAHDLLISNQVAKGFEQLAGDKVAMRLGGIYDLEGVMNASAQYHQPVLEALCAFVRDNTTGKTVGQGPTIDIQAALTVIGRRVDGRGRLDLSLANLPGVNLIGADLTGATLTNANLTGANLTGATLTGADLTRVNLTGAYLMGRTNLSGAYLANANLTDAHLLGAILTGAYLTGASLIGADLGLADLTRADLTRTNLISAHLDLANLSDADLASARLDDQKQLDEACGTNAKLPPGLTLKPCPLVAPLRRPARD
jgi:uncharacterized protein YjbI with pentapeptide repeats